MDTSQFVSIAKRILREFMERLTIYSLSVLAIVCSVAAKEIPKNTVPTAAAEKGSVGKFNGQEKAGSAKQNNPNLLPTCEGCFNSYSVEQPHARTKEEESKEASLDRLYRCYLWATIIGVIGAWFGLGLIWKQNKTIKDQLAEMRAASGQTNRLIEQVSVGANAALLNAQAVINTERAWITVDVEQIEVLTFKIVIKNVGKTPARFVSSFRWLFR